MPELCRIFYLREAMPNPTNPSEDLALKAAHFANSTSRHIFLTGKAGTGKTTFLQTLAASTHKSHLIVAPTGIAALNAGGVTIHSQFLLPLGSFVPGAGIPSDSPGRFYDAKFLVTRQPLNSIRKQVLREIELLIIDEVSMLRADVLDAVDQRLRSARRRMREPFGGVQLLLIGDLFQLPPIVKDYEWSVLSKHYPTPHFFSSEALRKAGFVYIELDKVFRQSDDTFINVLNNLRSNTCTQADIDTLNKRYVSADEYPENTVTLTTHNNQANAINRESLEALDTKTYKYKAQITGDFPENIYPLPETLELKIGAQIMFVKNDTNGSRFYNGKLAKVIALKDDSIRVKMSGEETEMNLETMEWSNIKYTLNADKQLEEETVGTFEQYPVKLAWAITVHKSQGLTFDRAIIDVGRAFAPGQIYVALSRLRSLEGLYLRTRISNSAVQNDTDVLDFQKVKDEQGSLDEILRKAQADFLEESLHQTFHFEQIRDQIAYVERKAGMKMEFTDADMRDALPNLKSNVQSENENSRIFRSQISQLLREGNYDLLKKRVAKASEYYLNFLFGLLYQAMLHREESAQFAKTKTYVKALDEVDQIIM
ncbi:MAG TPA: AAA family ATPase, partial [Cryomorphaceae bacterium]|nr:AAA family ATPase [Cryomorphaceae bacterium]